MRLLVIGRTGQLARALGAAGVGPCLGRDRVDLAVPGQAAAAIREAAPEVVINAAAFTAVDAAEDDRATAFRVNAEAVGEIAAAAAKCGAGLVHVSTDYVYDGSKPAAYVETDPTGPINVYGASKLAGEVAAYAANPVTVILRTAWVYSPWGRNFVTTMLRLAPQNDRLRIIGDQQGCPTSALDLARACLVAAGRMAKEGARCAGTYHYAGGGAPVSWAGFAAEIFRLAAARGVTVPAVEEISAAEYPTPASRPVNSVLDCGSFTRTFGTKPTPWRKALARVIDSVLETSI